MVYGIKGFAVLVVRFIVGFVASESGGFCFEDAQVHVCGPQIGGHFDSGDGDESSDSRVTEVVCDSITDNLPDYTSDFFLSSGGHINPHTAILLAESR
jgi:hypothetical protein